MNELTGTGMGCAHLHLGDPGEASEAAAELEELGYTALWIPDVGGDVFGTIERLLQATRSVTATTGVLNLWLHSAEETANAHARLTRTHGDRFLVGIGVSNADLVDAMTEPGRYRKPLASMAAYLDALDSAPTPLPRRATVLGAISPKMLEIARTRTAGVHSFNVTPGLTALAREALGPSALLLPQQMVVVTTDSDEAHAIARETLGYYLQLSNYNTNLRRVGFGDDDFADGGSNRVLDALVAWGSPEDI
ncbi:MAG TPA: TIGR03620 family F420-dependent LLM class oxidoreductase, partial [Acidimicrobiales bacterium]|nr:TIGR03620 family F420-dependent LLM class oxidoreductase [Acidimicrobiales bacterium]